VIFVTGDDAVPPRVALQSGVVGYLLKPFTADAVRDAVRDAMVWHRVAARPKPS
jgi:response regulator of citrate/malate metabolism